MAKLILLDGSIELGEEEKQKLIKISYFEALFLRWSAEKQEEYTVELTIPTIRLLLGEMTQLEVLTQAAKQAVDEARAELDLVGFNLAPYDIEVAQYPFTLYPLLEPYRVKQNRSLSNQLPTLTLETFQLILDWNKTITPKELDKVLDQDDFPGYLRLIWQWDPTWFFITSLSVGLIKRICQFPHIFQTHPTFTRDHLIQLINRFPNDSPLSNFFKDVYQLSEEERIEFLLGGKPTHAQLLKIVRQDPHYLCRCLVISERDSPTWEEFRQLLNACVDLPKCPLTDEQINIFSGQAQIILEKWKEVQIFPADDPATYSGQFDRAFGDNSIGMMKRILRIFPTYPYRLDIRFRANIKAAADLVTAYPHLVVRISPVLCYTDGFTPSDLEFILQSSPMFEFGVSRHVFREESIQLLIKHQAHCHPNNVFIGSPEIADRMFLATIQTGLIPHVQYLFYFIRLQHWKHLSLFEPMYCRYSARSELLTNIMASGNHDVIKQFLSWEMTLH